MADYREIKCPYGDDFEGGDECDRCEQYELCMETSSANVIEYSEYEALKKENHELAIKYDNAMNMVINEQENIIKLRSKIDKAIKEIEERKKCLHTDIYNGDSIEFGKGLDLALKILKEHIEK